jgi:hypothetical protein
MKLKPSAKNSVKVGAVYEHYKGREYYVLAVGKHSETLEEMVTYISLYDNTESQVWIRPLKMFNETVEFEGNKTPRFKLVAK